MSHCCGVCYEDVVEFVTLACGHAQSCRSCIQRIAAAHGSGDVRCPWCRHVTRLPPPAPAVGTENARESRPHTEVPLEPASPDAEQQPLDAEVTGGCLARARRSLLALAAAAAAAVGILPPLTTGASGLGQKRRPCNGIYCGEPVEDDASSPEMARCRRCRDRDALFAECRPRD